MVGHQAIRMGDESELVMGHSETVQEIIAVLVCEKGQLLIIPPGEYVIKGARVFDSDLSGHNNVRRDCRS